CCGTPVATPWPMPGTIRGRCKHGSATRTSSTRSGTPSWRRTGSRISGDRAPRDPTQFRTIQVCPKDLGALPGHPEPAVSWHNGFRGGAHARPKTTPVHHPARRRGGVAARGPRAPAGDASDWVPKRRLLRLLLPPVSDRASAGVGVGAPRELAVELGEQRDAVGDAKLPAGRNKRRVLHWERA